MREIRTREQIEGGMDFGNSFNGQIREILLDIRDLLLEVKNK